MTPVRLAVVGAGNRGAHAYARYCLKHPDEARVVAVADPNAGRRDALGDAHSIDAHHRHSDVYELLADGPKLDGVVVATPDRMHVRPAEAALERGLDVLMEKPVTHDRDELLHLAVTEATSTGTITVGHVLRYTPFFQKIKLLLDEGRIGRLVTVQYTENVGYWHFAHSFVRGNWRRHDESSPMLLAKACHDLDMLRWLVGAPCREVTSMGGLTWFRSDMAPAGAPEHCIDGCPIGDTCPYNAERYYRHDLARHTGSPVSVITDDLSDEGRQRALHGQYGRCVYRCDNDVADHQGVLLSFANGVTANLLVTGLTSENTRTLTLMGSHGEMRGHLERGEIEVREFGPGPHDSGMHADVDQYPAMAPPPGRRHELVQVKGGSGHSGGDEGIMRTFVRQCRQHRTGEIAEETHTRLDESIESHLMAYAAEEARQTGRAVLLADNPV